MLDSRSEELLKIADRCFVRKAKRDVLNQEIAELFYPARADFTTEVDYADYAGVVADGTTILARETLGTSMEAMLRQGDFFKIGTGDAARDKKIDNARSLELATAMLRSIWRDPRTQTQVAGREVDMDWVSFGHGVMSIEAAAGRKHLVCKGHHPRDNAWMQNEDGIVDTNFRRMKLTARVMKRLIATGRWNGVLHHDVELAAQIEPDKEFEIQHVLMPAEEVYGSDARKMREIRHPFLSCYIDKANRTYLHEMGAPVFNYVIPRWVRLGTDPVGFSPVATNALADARMLQSIALTVLEQAEKAADPPMIGSAEVFVRDLNFGAGDFTEVDLPEGAKLQDVMSTLDTSDNVRLGVEIKADIRELIAQAWLLNKLFLPQLRDMREVEVMVRTDEFRRAALPFFSPIETQYHALWLGTMFDMALAVGLIPTDIFPADLAGEDVNFTFETPLNEADGMKVVNAFNQATQIIAAGATVDPTINNMFDFRAATRDAVRGAGAKADWLLTDIKAREKDKEAERLQQLQQAASIVQQGAGVVADASNAAIGAQNAGLMPA